MTQESMIDTLLAPHFSEKSTNASEIGRYFVFKVRKNANKPAIKQAVEAMFDVKVESVRVSNMHGKSRRFRQVVGKTQAWKKAYVKLKEGFDINFIGSEK